MNRPCELIDREQPQSPDATQAGAKVSFYEDVMTKRK